ncbi:cell envelope-related function transcriptional attenuator common domain-containing protein [Asanoa hainanensis]|uniref:Cell envelope-related function transcriptional attenuator common domain-containing protein n=1 Tax=Asanoa hainanensis TaxID=560556 RepID=A0A239GU82_9ACTN|nr:cell envelope-related function transcriptional attenuator common domain-containing protein [Asanoa hainanensis]
MAGPELIDADQTPTSPVASDTPAPQEPKRKRRKLRLFLLITGLVLVVLAGGGALAGVLYVRGVEKSIDKVDAFTEVPAQHRPDKLVAEAMNILLLGSDSRDPDNTEGSRSDTIILLHLPSDRATAQLISIPRDTWVHVPESKDGKHGNRDAKINASFAWGGLPLMVQSVEEFTKVRIDHVVLIDFGGFQQIVDALGGIDVDVDQNFTSHHPPYRKFTKGTMHMDGTVALDFARQRKQLADGDFGRIRHQQAVIRAILDKAASGGLLTNPAGLNSFLKATANAVAVDKTLSILDLAPQLRHLRSDSLAFLTTPTKGTGMVGSESVVFADTTKSKQLYDAVRRDAVREILDKAKAS